MRLILNLSGIFIFLTIIPMFLLADETSASIGLNIIQGLVAGIYLVIIGLVWSFLKFIYKKIFK